MGIRPEIDPVWRNRCEATTTGHCERCGTLDRVRLVTPILKGGRGATILGLPAWLCWTCYEAQGDRPTPREVGP